MMNAFVDSILYSYAQIFFSNRRWFGGTVLATTFLVPEMGIVALLGVIVSNATASLLAFDETKIRSGFYGFNGILFGAAAVFYFKLSAFLIVLILLFIVITFFVSAVLEHFLASMLNLPGLSLPFVLTLYMFVIFLTNFDTVTPNLVEVTGSEYVTFLPPLVATYFKSLALIVFQPYALAGVVFAVALLLLSRTMFILSCAGFATAAVTVHVLFTNPPEYLVILSGFNAILTAFALGGSLIIPSGKSFLLTIASSVLVVVLTGFFLQFLAPYRLPVLVLPFNFLVLSVVYSLKFRREQSELVLLYFTPGTPEENFYYHHNRVSRFQKFKTVVPELPFFGEWNVSQGQNGAITHKGTWRHAWDFVVKDETGSEFSGNGSALKDYYCYELPVIAPLDGTVVRVVDGIPENAAGETNLKSNWGNTVIIDHGNTIFSALSHLQASSIKVAVGDKVKKGSTLASCGNSGRSPTPHLHFQFQHTDKLGDKTLEYPIGHFLERTEDGFTLHTFAHPREGMRVRNVTTHKLITRAFDFKLGDMLAFSCRQGSDVFEEEWEVKVNINNTLYIESSRNATVHLVVIGKVFFLTHFFGNRKSALYHFYLTAIQVPMGYEPNLHWTDAYPLSQLLSNPVRYLSELFLLANPLRVRASFRFAAKAEGDTGFVMHTGITVEGSALFRWYRKVWQGHLSVDAEGRLNEITVRAPDDATFHATRTNTEENTE